MEEDKVKTELSKLTMNIHLFFLFSFFLEETIRKDQTRIRSNSTLVFPITERTPEFIETSRGFIHLNSRRRMRMLVGRSMRKWRWWCLVKCAMACKSCKSATCRGSLMIASPVQREIASGHLYLCAFLISPCNSSPFRANLNRGKERSSIRDRGIQQFKILRDQLSNCLENFSDFKLWMQFLVNDFLTHLK